MVKIFDCFTVKRRYFVVKEDNMIEILKMIQSSLSAGYSMGIGNCRLDEGSLSWIVRVDLTDNQWKSLLMECKIKKYSLVIKDVPNRMCFERVKGS